MIFFGGTANPALAMSVSRHLKTMLCDVALIRFTDGELSVKIKESVMRRDVYILQTISEPVNDHLMELLICLDAFKRAGARSVTAVVPYLAYSRKEKKDTRQDPISGKLVANLLETAGMNALITVDLHADAIEGFFDVPVVNMSAMEIFAAQFKATDLQDVVVVAPDMGGAKRARSFARLLNVPVVILEKTRPHNSPESEVMTVIGDVSGKEAIIIDDMVSTGGTLVNAAKFLKERGASKINVCVTHALLSGNAVEKIVPSVIDRFIVTDSVPIPATKHFPQLEVVSLAAMIAREIQERQTH